MTDTLPSTDETAKLLGFELEPFEGLPVIQSKIEIPSAAGGLRDAMKIEPRAWRKGDTTFVLMECTVGKVRFDPVTDDETGPQARVHVLHAIAGTVLAPEVAKTWIDEQKDRILKAREEALGIQQVAELNPDGSPAAGMGDVDPDVTDDDGFIDADKLKAVLGKVRKDDLRAMCDAEHVEYPPRARGDQLVELLMEHVPDLAEKVAKVADNVTPIRGEDG